MLGLLAAGMSMSASESKSKIVEGSRVSLSFFLYWCSVSCVMWSGALDSSDLLSYSIIPLASHISTLL